MVVWTCVSIIEDDVGRYLFSYVMTDTNLKRVSFSYAASCTDNEQSTAYLEWQR